MIRKILYVSLVALLLQMGSANAGTTGSEDLKGNSSTQDTA